MRILLIMLLAATTVAWSAESSKTATVKKSRAEVRREAIKEARGAIARAPQNLVPQFYVSQRSPIRTVSFARRGSDIELTWLGSMDRVYEVHRGFDPLFIPGPATQIVTAIGNVFTEWSALKLRPVKYYYQIIER